MNNTVPALSPAARGSRHVVYLRKFMSVSILRRSFVFTNI